MRGLPWMAVARLTVQDKPIRRTSRGPTQHRAATDEGEGIAVDSGGNAYITGYTTSSTFPTQNPFDSTANGLDDAFVAKLAPPSITINNVSVTEGAAGTTVNANFTVSLSVATNEP